MPHAPCGSLGRRFTAAVADNRASRRGFQRAGFRPGRTFGNVPFGPHVLLVRRRHHRQEPL